MAEDKTSKNTEGPKASVPNSSDISGMLNNLAKASKEAVPVMKTLLDSMASINKMISWKGYWNAFAFNAIHKTINLYFANFAQLITVIAKEFQKLNASPELPKIIELLGGKEGVEITNNVVGKDTQKTKTVKTGRKMGFLEVIKNFFELPSLISSLSWTLFSPVHRAITMMKVDAVMSTFTDIVKRIAELKGVTGTASDEMQETAIDVDTICQIVGMFPTMLENLAGPGFLKRKKIDKFLDWIVGDTTDDMVDKNKNTEENLKKKKKLSLFDRISALMLKVKNAAGSADIANRSTESIKKFLSGVNDIFSGISKMSGKWLLAMLPVNIAFLGFAYTMKLLFSELIYVDQQRESFESTNSLDGLSEIIDDLSSIFGELAAIAESTKSSKKSIKQMEFVIKGLTVIMKELSMLGASAGDKTEKGLKKLEDVLFGKKHGLVTIFRRLGSKRNKQNVKDAMIFVGAVALAIVAIALLGVLILISLPVMVAGLVGFALVSFLLVGIVATLATISKRGKGDVMQLLLLIGGVMLATIAIFILGEFIMNAYWVMLIGLGGFALITGLLIVTMVVMGKFIKKALQSTMPLLILIAAVTLATLAIFILSQMLEKHSAVMWEGFGMFAAIIVLLSGVLVGLSFVTGPIMVGAVAMAVIAGALLLIVSSFTLFVFTLERLVKLEIPAEKKDTILSDILRPIKGMMAFMWENKKYFNPIALGLAVANVMLMLPIFIAVGIMARILSGLASLKVPDDNAVWDPQKKAWSSYHKMDESDFTTAANNAVTIMTTLLGAFEDERVKNIKEYSAGALIKIGLAMSVLTGLKPLITMISQLANLAVPEDNAVWDPKKQMWSGYRKMTDTDFENASKNALKIMTNLLAVFSTPEAEKIKDYSAWALVKIGLVMDVLKDMKPIIDMMCQLANMSVPAKDAVWDPNKKTWSSYRMLNMEKGGDLDKAAENAKRILVTLLEAFSEIDVSTIEDMSKRTLKKIDLALGVYGHLQPMIDNIEMFATGKYQRYDSNGKPIGDAINIADKTVLESVTKNIVALIGSFTDAFNDETLVANLIKVNDNADSYTEFSDLVKETIMKLQDPAAWLLSDKFDPERFRPNVFSAVRSPMDAFNVAYPLQIITQNMSLYRAACATITHVEKPLEMLKDFEPETFKTKVYSAVRDPLQALNIKYPHVLLNANMDALERLIKIHNEAGKSKLKPEDFDKFVKSGVRFLTRINTMKLTNLKSAVQLFEQLSYITRNLHGNFNKLADTLQEGIVVKLKEISEHLDVITKNKYGVSLNTGETASQTLSTMTNAEKEVRRAEKTAPAQTNDKTKKTPDKKINNQDIKEVVRTLSEIMTKLNEISNKIY